MNLSAAPHEQAGSRDWGPHDQEEVDRHEFHPQAARNVHQPSAHRIPVSLVWRIVACTVCSMRNLTPTPNCSVQLAMEQTVLRSADGGSAVFLWLSKLQGREILFWPFRSVYSDVWSKSMRAMMPVTEFQTTEEHSNRNFRYTDIVYAKREALALKKSIFFDSSTCLNRRNTVQTVRGLRWCMEE